MLIALSVLPVALDGGLSGEVAEAEEIEPFAQVFSTNTNGAIDSIGNALLSCGTSTNCQQTLAGTRDLGNGNFSMVFDDADDAVLPAAISAQTTSSSSRAVLAMPVGSTVLYAGLYWSAESNSGSRNRLDFLVPGAAGYTQIIGQVDAAGSLYQARADVTALVAGAGNGDYWGGDIQAFTGGNTYAAWSMVVVYSNPTLPTRNLTVFEGFGRVTSSFRTLDVPISGFLTPPFGSVNAEIGVIAYEGDRNIPGDQVLIDTDPGAGTTFVNLTDGSNPATNFGNGSISDAGVADTSGTPSTINNLSVDIDEFATVNTLANAQTSTTVRFQTQGDFWYPGVLTTAIDLFVPEFPAVVKTVVDRNGGTTVPGDILDYTISFTNTGNDAAIDSVVRDVIPDDTTFVPGSIRVDGVGQTDATNTGATDYADFDGSQIIGRIGTGATGTAGGTLVPNAFSEIKFAVTVDASARGTDIENSATLDYTALTIDEPFTFRTNQVVTPVPPLADLAITKSASPNPAVPGTDETWTIEISNAGPNTATGIELTDTLPAGVTFGSVTGATCTGATTLTCDIADIAAGSSRTVVITTPVDPGVANGTYLQNSAAVTLDQEDSQPSNNSTIAGVSARSQADLSITKTDDADPVAVGDSITYTLVATNAGPSAARDVRVSDNPDGATTVTAISGSGGTGGVTCDPGSRTCTVPTLEVGDSLTVTVTVDVRPFASGSVTNSAFVQSPTPDDNQADNIVSEPTVITPIADVTVTKTITSGALIAGETVTYNVRVENDGPSPAAAATMTDTLPAELTLVSVASPIGTCSGDPTISCDLGTLGADATVDIVVTATVAADANGATISNTAAVSTSTDQGANAAPDSSTVTATVTNSSDLRIVKEVSDNLLLIGGPFDYTLTVTNDGPSVTDAVATITDAVPGELSLDTPAPAGCSYSGQNVTCSVPAGLAVGDSATFVLTGIVGGAGGTQIANTATVTYPTDPNAANDSSTATTELATEADVRIDKEWAAASVVAGQDTTFTLVVVNDGVSPAAAVNVVDTIANGTIVSATSTAGSCTGIGTDSLDCTLGTMPNGATETITVVVAIDADATGGPLSNTASVASPTPDRNPGNNSDTDLITVTRSADLTVTKAASDPAPLAGDTITYTVEISNLGPSTATASFLGDSLPAGLSFVPGSFTVAGAPNAPATPCTVPGGVITCDLGELPVSPTPAVITYDVVIDASTDPGPVVNTATATSTTPDPTPATVDETVTVATAADLSATKTASLGTGTPGGPLTYTVVVANAGPSDARLVVVDDIAPAGFAVASATSTQGTCDLTVSCTIGTIAPAGSAEITIVGSIDSGFGDATITNTAVVSADTFDPNDPVNGVDDNTGAVTIPVEPRADLAIVKSASPATIEAGGGEVTYSIGVSNVGPSDSTNVTVDDTLPADFVVDSVASSQGGCTAFPCNLGTITAGQAPASVTVVGFFPSDVAAGTATNTASVTSPDVVDPDTTNNTDSADVEITIAADVTVAKAGPDAVVAGDRRTEDPGNPGTFTGGAQYVLSVSNDGPSDATGVVLSDTLDPAILDVANVVLAATPPGVCVPTNTGGVIECDIGDLPIGGLVTLNVIVDVRPDAPAGVDILDNAAGVVSATDDPNPANDTAVVEADVTVSADVAVAKTKLADSVYGASNTQFVAGETLSYQIVVTNNGPSDATGVVVTDDPPAPVTLGTVTSSPAGCAALPCTIGDLAVGDSVTVTVQATVDQNTTSTSVTNTASVTADTADGNSANDTDDVTNGVVKRADVELVSKTSAPDPVIAGQDLTYTIVGRNNGPSTATAVVITDTVPAGTTLVSSSLPASCTTNGTVAGSTITCALGNLPSGTESTRSFTVKVDADATGSISNTAAVASATAQPAIGVNDPDATLDDTRTETTAIGGEADLGITKAATPATAVPGEPLSYTLTVTNAGPSTARDVVVSDDVTGIFDGVVTVTTPAGVTCDLTVDCDPFDLPVGTSTFTISGTAAAATTAPIGNTATVSAATPEPAGATLPNSATINTPIAPSADLTITKVDDVVTTVDPTGAIEYTIVVSNDGPSDAQAVVISDVLPAAVQGAVVTSAPAGCTALPCTVPTLAAGSDITLTVAGTISDRAVGTISNTATVTSDTPDPDTASNSATQVTAITPVADVSVTKTLNTSPLIAGRPARYTLVVNNNGPARATAVELVEALPAGTTFTAISSPIGTCDSAPVAGEISCLLGNLNDQASVTILVDVLVGEATTAALVNTATVSTSTQQPAGGGNPDSATTTSPVTVNADVEVKKSLVQDSLVAGDTFTYEIEITNNGPSTAALPITLEDTLPAQIDPLVPVVLSNTTDCAYTAATRLVSCTFTDDIPVGGAPIILTIEGAILSGAGAVAANTATITTADDPNTPGNNTSTATADIVANADLVMTKVFDDAAMIAGETTTFTLTVANEGPSDADDVVITDALPAGMTVISATPTPVGGGCDISEPTVISCDIGTLVATTSASVDVVVALDPDAAAGPLNNTASVTSSTPDRNPETNVATDTIQITREADISISKDASVTSILAGNQITYTIGYRNDGPSTAEASVIGDALPDGTSFVLPLPANCTGDAGILDCDLGTIAPMAPGDPDLTFTYTVLVDEAVANNTDLINTANISSITPPPGGTPPAPGTATVEVATESDVELLSKDASPDPVVAGEIVTYTIAARNNGPSLATNMTIVDDFPSSLTPVLPLPAGCSLVAGDLSCNVGDIRTGDTATVVFSATVGADQLAGVDIANDASVSADPVDPTPGNDSVTESVAVIAQADISIAKTATPTPAVPGQPITYGIVVINAGPSDAQSVVVSDPVPAGVTFTTATASDGSTCTTAASCDLGVLAAGESVTITITGAVLNTTTAPIVNEATVTSPTPASPTGPVRTVSITTPVAPIADLAIAKSLSPTPPVPGSPVQYTITVTNPGPSAAQNVVVTDTIDAAVTGLVTASAGCAIAGQEITCTTPTLAPGTQTIVVTGNLAADFVGTLSNTAAVATDTPQGANASPDTATVAQPAAPDADVAITKVATPDPVIAGEALVYTLTVSNNGPSVATGVVVDDVLPSGFDLSDITSSVGDCVEVPCTIGTLLVGQSESVTISGTVGAELTDIDPNTASVSAATTDWTAGNNTATADPVVNESASLTTTKTLTVPADGIVVPGESVTWDIVVSNDGPSDALDVEVDDTIPSYLTNVAISSVPAGCTAFPCDIGTLESAASVTITVTADVPPGTPTGNLVNSAATSSSTPDPDPTDNNPVAANPIVPAADLSIVKTGPATLTPGVAASYVVTVTNNGPSDAGAISITDTIPAAFDPATITEISPTADCTIVDLSVSCTQAVLEDQATITVTITGTVLSGFVGSTIENTASVTSVTPDPVPGPASNSSTTTAAVTPEADLSMTKSLTTAPPVPGQAVTYEIVVTNGGPSAAQAVVVTDTVNAAITNLATTTPNCSFVGQDLTCNLGTVEPGVTTIGFTGDLDEAFTGILFNTANVTTTTPEVLGSAPNFATSGESAEPDADLRLTKTVSPTPVNAGETVTYLITVDNLGPSTATGVEVSDILPAGFTPAVGGITSSQGACTAVPCELGTIADQGSATVTIVGTIDADVIDIDPNFATVTADTPDSDTSNNGDDADPTVETSADLTVTKTAAPLVLIPGEPVQYTITVANAGPSDALATQVTDSVPTELTGVVITSSQGGCTAFPCDLGTVDAGSSETITVTALVPSDVTAASITNSATATSTTTDPTPADNTGTTTNSVVPEADLVTTKVGPTTDAVPGETVTYTVTVENNGPSDAFALTIDDDLDAAFDPVGVTAVSASGASCVVTGLVVDCTQSTLASGDSTVVEITATVLASYTGATIGNAAIAGSVTPDSTPSDNTSTVSTPVAASADLSITKVDDITTQVNPGDPIEYTITVSNAGPSDAQAVEVADTIPAILNNVVVSSVPAGCAAFPCAIGTLAAGTDVVITVTADADADALDEIVNTASVSTTTPDPSPGDESATETTAVTPYADLGVAKTLVRPVGGPVAGTPARYQLTITNDGPATAIAAVLTDTLPAGTTFVSASTPVGSCGEASGTLTCNFGDLPNGASVTVLVNVDVAADRTAPLVNAASIDSPTVFDPNAANDTVSISSPVQVRADLQVAKTLRDAPIVAGTPFFYDVTITNNGPSTSVEDIVFTDTLPSQVDLTTVDATLPTECVRSGADITCTFTPNLVANDTIEFAIGGETLAGVTNISPNDAAVSTVDDPAVDQVDPNLVNNVTQATGAVDTEADLVLAKTFADTTTIAGDGTIEFTLVVTNNGPSDALDVEITDVLPAGLTVVGTPVPTFSDASTGSCAVATAAGIDTLTCGVDDVDGRLADGATMTVFVTAEVDPDQPAGPLSNTADVATSTTDRSPANNTASDAITVTREAELTVGKVANPASQNAGLDVAYTVTVQNLGPSTAEATVLGDALPAGMTIQPGSIVIAGAPIGAACTLPGGILACDLGLLPAPSGAVTVDYTVSIDPDLDPAVVSLVNAATITSATPPAGGTPTPPATATVALDTEADLELVGKTASPTTVTAGQNTTYTVVVRNNGPSTARNVMIDDTIPAGVTVISQSAGCAYTAAADIASTSTLSCDLGDVDPATDPSDTLTVTYEVTVDESVTASTLTNSATVSSDTAEPAIDPSPNTVTEDIAIVTEADLSIVKTAAPVPAVPGETLTYTIAVTNAGPSTARNVVVTDDITGIFETSPAVTVTPGGGTTCTTAVVCDPFDLPVGTTTLTISGTALQTTTDAISNTASVASDTDQPVGDPAVETSTISTPVAPTADLSIVKTITTDPVVPGRPVTFQIVVDNPGPSAAQDVIVADTFDSALTGIMVDSVVGAPVADCVVTGQDLTCDHGTVSAGTITITVTADLAATFTGVLDNTATVATGTDEGLNVSPNTSTVSAPTVPTADVSLAKVGTPVTAGENVTYTITATNNGPSTATGVRVLDTLPAGLTLVSVSSSQGGCTALPCLLGSLPLGGAADVTVVGTLDPSATTLAPNTARVSTTSLDPNDGPGSNNFASSTPTVSTEAQLTTTKTQTTSPAVPGTPVEWTIVVANAGPSDALAVEVDDALPAEVVGAVFGSPGATCTATGCDLGTIAAGTQKTITVTANLPADVAPGRLANTATTTSATPTAVGSVLSATTDEPITPSADVQIVKTASPAPLVPGEPVTYTLTLTNNGPSDAQGVDVTDRLPTAIDLTEAVTIVAADAACNRTGRDVGCVITTLADGATSVITITGTVDETTLSDVSNTALMTTATADPTAGNDTSSVTSAVAPQADIGLAKVFVTDPIVPGAPVEFEITVTNNGPSAAQDVVVVDTLPAEYTSVSSATAGCAVVGNAVTCDLGDVAPGARFISVSGVLASGHLGATSNAASLTTSTTQVGVLPDTTTVAGSAAPEADLAITKSASPDPVIAGENVTYLITVDNLGPSDSLDVTVDDVLPTGLTLVSVTPSQGACTALPCNLGTIVDESSATVTVVAELDSSALTLDANSASVASPTTPDSTTANNTDTAQPAVSTQADLITTKVLSTPTAVPGAPLRWTITVQNPGPSDALGVSVADTVTGVVDNVAIASSQGGCTAFPCDLGTIAAGAQATITVDADMPADATANIVENQATTTSATPDGTPLDNNPIASNPVAPAADLRIVKVGPAVGVVAGTAVQWSITVVNDGPSDSRDVVITDALPAAVDPTSVVVTSPTATCRATGLAVECTQDVIADGGTVTIVIDAVLRADTVGPIENTANVVSLSTADLDPTDNSATSNSPNAPLAAVSITGSATPDPVTAGTDVDFEFVISNGGPSNAAGTIVTIPLPASVAVNGTPVLVGAPAGATVTVVGGQVIVDLGSLPPDTPVTLTFTGTVAPGQPVGPLDVPARVETTTNQDDTTDDATTVLLNVVADVDLSIVKTSDVQSVRFGDDIVFTLTVTNDGPSDSVTSTIVDELPASLEPTAVTDSGGTCVIEGNTVTCSNPVIPADGGTYEVVITARAIGNGAGVNTATVDCGCPADVLAVSGDAPFDIERVSDLSITKTANLTVASAGQQVIYTITVANAGPDTAVGVQVVDLLPSGLGFMSANPSTGSYSQTTGVWQIGDVAVGETPTLTLAAQATGVGLVTNRVTVSSDVTDPVAGNDTAAVGVTINPGLIPATGADSGQWLRLGFGSFFLGVGLVLLGRRRRRSATEAPSV